MVNNMVDERKKRRTEDVVYSVHDVINTLISVLRDAGYSMNFDGWTLKYHIDIGMLVRLVADGIPDFPVGSNWLLEASGHDWLVNSIEAVDDKFSVVFLLEGEI
jgi:hypothetical protein